MSRGITGREPDPREVYADIIDLPHWQSPTRPRMTLYDRAAQFAPFAALAGYEDMVSEEARQVDSRIEPGEEDLALLNRKLGRIREAVDAGERPEVTITYFVPDPMKTGGRYETVTAGIRKADDISGKLILETRTGAAGSYVEIALRDVLDIQGGIVDQIW